MLHFAHRAPERMDGGFGPRGSHTDVWGFATIVLHLATGEQPYNGLSIMQILCAMMKYQSPAVPSTLPEWLQHVLLQCFSFDVAARPSAAQVLQVSSASPCDHLRCLHVVNRDCASLIRSRFGCGLLFWCSDSRPW